MTDHPTSQITALTYALNLLGIKAKSWEGTTKEGEAIKRIYLPSSPAVSIYIDVTKADPDARSGADLFEGCEIKAFVKGKKPEGSAAE